MNSLSSKPSKQVTTGFQTKSVLYEECQETHFRGIDNIYMTYFGLLVSYAKKMTYGDHCLAEDLVSLTFIKVLNHKPDIISLSKKEVLSYLKASVKNAFCSHYQKQVRRKKLSTKMPIQEFTPETDYNPNDILANLPQIQRECLQKYLEGFNYEEIATILEISHDKVRNSMYFGRKKLGKIL